NQNDYNYKIGKFFLDNSRFTILTIFILILLGVFTTLNLKTTGFPNPDVGVVIVRSIYPGASSDSVVKDVTKPIENVIKTIDGIETYSSNSQNSVSIVSLTIKPGFKTDTVQNKISSDVKSIVLPNNVETSISTPSIGAPDFIFTLTDNNNARLFDSYKKFKDSVSNLSDTKSLKVENDIQSQVEVKLDQEKMNKNGVQIQDVQKALKSLNESLPITSSVAIDSKKSSVVAQYAKKPEYKNLNDLEVSITQGPTGGSVVKLSDITNSININQKFLNEFSLFTASRNNNSEVKNSVVLNIFANNGIDTNKYLEKIEESIKEIDSISYNTGASDKTTLLANYEVTEQNKEQVDEVLSGLVGGPLNISNKTLANVGWLLGGIQLVFLVMMAFVSWRAAIIASLSIPLSLIFTNIYLYLIGESLNTLVLFSFVLVIGLVVDPALVIIESIQRKIDAGLKGKAAALAAIKDVGGGLFMATLTNIIVFAPFGLISGILGQIFAYIPLTIVPATIGSYLVPLIVLTWISSALLKKSKNSKAKISENADPYLVEKELHKSEIENMWSVAKWLVNVNRKVLNSHWAIRAGIILSTLVLSIVVTIFIFANNQIKTVQFSSPDNPANLLLTVNHKTGTLNKTKNDINKRVITEIMNNSDVFEVSPYLQETYRIEMKPSTERKQISTKTADDLNKVVRDSFSNEVLDIKVQILANGPASSNYNIQLALIEEDVTKAKDKVKKVVDEIKNLCEKDGKFSINSNCNGTKPEIIRIDDGFTGKENPVNYIEFEREKLLQKGFVLPNIQGPSIILPTSQIKNYFNIDDNKSQLEVINGDTTLPVIIESNVKKPESIDDLRNLNLINGRGQPVPLNEIATVVVDNPPASITRIKGETQSIIKLGYDKAYSDQRASGLITNAIVDHFKSTSITDKIDIKKDSLKSYSEGGVASFLKSFQELIIALLFAILSTYFVLAIFFKSLSSPLAILYTIPLTFTGVFPALAYLGSAQFGFLEIIGLIILVGIVENVAIFLIDSANQMIVNDGLSDKEAIAISSGLRLRPVLLTKLTAIASLTPLALLSETYRPLSLVIIFGLLASGFTSLITTPILYIFFRRLSSYCGNIFRKMFKIKKTDLMPKKEIIEY
ncbi:MAG: efflux RND transporter permease subunit, partial [Patescibacteria group bacterium]